MEELINQIIALFQVNRSIYLQSGRSYLFIGQCSTRIAGNIYPIAFQYQISASNKKCITIGFIRYMYERVLETGAIPTRQEMQENYLSEYTSRPCNYSVSKSIVDSLLAQGNT
jgi:hypothetical protein